MNKYNLIITTLIMSISFFAHPMEPEEKRGHKRARFSDKNLKEETKAHDEELFKCVGCLHIDGVIGALVDGADVNSKNKNGHFPLWLVALDPLTQTSHIGMATRIVKLLLVNGAYPNPTNNNGLSLLTALRSFSPIERYRRRDIISLITHAARRKGLLPARVLRRRLPPRSPRPARQLVRHSLGDDGNFSEGSGGSVLS
jgi:hypothetical protein